MRTPGLAFGLALGAACEPIEAEPVDSAAASPDAGEPTPFADERGTVRLLLLSPDLAPSCAAGQACADLWVGDAPLPLATFLPFGASTGPIAFPHTATTLHLRAGAQTALSMPVEDITPESPQTLLVFGLASAAGARHERLSDTIAAPPVGKVRARITHLLYGREGTEIEVRAGANRVAPPLRFGETSDLILLDRAAHTWTIDLDAPGLSPIPVRWNPAGLGEAAPWLDLLLVPAPGTQALPLLLVHSPTSNAPATFPPG